MINSTTSRTESDIRKEAEKYSRSEQRSAGLLIVGLILETVAGWYFSDGKSPFETWAITLASLAVAFAVVGEVRYGRLAENARSELDNISEAKLGEAIRRAAEAHEHAAKAEQEAQQAKERTAEIERVTAWRRVSWKQSQAITRALREKASLLDLLIEYERGDPEAFSYALEIARMFSSAGVTKIRDTSNSHIGRPIFGLHVRVSSELAEAGSEAAFSLAELPIAYWVGDNSTHLPRNEQAPNIYIWVGSKPPVSFASTGGDNP